MHSDKSRLKYLFERYFNGKATAEEREELAGLFDSNEFKDELMAEMQGAWEEFGGEGMVVPPERSEQIIANVFAAARSQETYSLPSGGRRWWRYAAAAAVISVIAVTVWLAADKPPVTSTPVAATVPAKSIIEAPGSSKAVITLANGKQIFLDKTSSGAMVDLDNANLYKVNDGEIVYRGSASAGDKLEYNTLTIPKGSRVIQLQLSDGTKVWLNSASSLRYPVVFARNERHVEITGEAYFEVAKDSSRKFFVTSKDVRTEVLGTHFNVNMYEDEDEAKITLVEGSIKVSKGRSENKLTPNQQIQIRSNDKTVIIPNADIEQVVAWKNGQFSLNRTNFPELMRQVARWYDVDIVYSGEIPKRKFGGSISRDVNLNTLLQALGEQDVETKLEGRKLTIMPN